MFIKPTARDTKRFNGCVVREFMDLAYTASLPSEMTVSCADYVDFLSEYRVFCHRGAIVGVKHYKGDYKLFPDFEIIEAAIARFDHSPIAYGVDFGITADSRCLLVEVNDAWCLGSYGLEPVTYANMLADRWHEMTACR